MANEIVIAGPELVLATVPVTTKMPAPMITPTPKMTRSRTPRFFFSRCSGSSVSAMDCSTDLVRNTFMQSNLCDPARWWNPASPEGGVDELPRARGQLVGGDAVPLLHQRGHLVEV